MQKGLNRVFSLVLPARCVGCGERGDSFICKRCREGISMIPFHCTRCAEPLPTGFHHFCGGCIEKELKIDFALTCYPYEGVLRETMIFLKSKGIPALWWELKGLFVEALYFRKEQGVASEFESAHVVVPVPLHWRRFWRREFNQSYWLAREVAGFLGLSCDTGLMRVRATHHQRGYSLKERIKNVRGAFKVDGGFEGKRVVLVDDIATSLATANEAAKTLKKAGATWVGLITFARTLRNHPLG